MHKATWSDVRMFITLYGVQVGDVEERLGLPVGTFSRVWGFDPNGYPSLEMWMRVRDAVIDIETEQRKVREQTIAQIIERGDRRPSRA